MKKQKAKKKKQDLNINGKKYIQVLQKVRYCIYFSFLAMSASLKTKHKRRLQTSWNNACC